MWQIIANLIGGPLVSGLIKAYQAKLTATNTSEHIAADLAAREVEVQGREIEAQKQLKIAEVGHPLEPEKLFAYVIVIYFIKIVIWDKVIGSFVGYTDNMFRTDPLTGEAVGWAAMVMSFYFAKRGIENVVRIIKR